MTQKVMIVTFWGMRQPTRGAQVEVRAKFGEIEHPRSLCWVMSKMLGTFEVKNWLRQETQVGWSMRKKDRIMTF